MREIFIEINQQFVNKKIFFRKNFVFCSTKRKYSVMKNFLNYTDVLFFTLILLVKTWLFSCAIDPSLTASIANHELFIVRLSLNYLASCLIITAIAYLIHSKVWRIVVLVLTDIWLIANLIYFRSYNDLLNSWCLLSISNLSGFETAIGTFLEWSDLAFVALSLLYGVCAFLLRNHSVYKKLYPTLTCLFLGLGLNIPQMIVSLHVGIPCNPYNKYYHDVSMGRVWYCTTYSLHKHFINELMASLSKDDISISNFMDETKLLQFVRPSDTYPETTPAPYNIVIVFFESLENWTTHLAVDNEEITPNLNLFSKSPRVHHMQLVPQVAQGMSSDAQLIVLTGLLPIKNGAVCMRFPRNAYFTLLKSCEFSKKEMYIPTAPTCWNQAAMCQAYGFEDLYATECADQQLIDTLCNDIKKMEQPYFLMGITMASHSPFTKYADDSQLQLANVKDTELRNYLRCVNYTDACLGQLIRQITDTPLSENTILLIMGDHTIFYPKKRERFFRELSYQADPSSALVPAFLYLPHSVETTNQEETLYQMDVYPTLLALLNENYIWLGVGKNILDNTPRIISADSAAYISNSIIQQNFFYRLASQ